MKLRDHRIFNRGRQTRQSLRSAEESAEMSAQMIQETNHSETAIVTEFISHTESFLRTSVTVDESEGFVAETLNFLVDLCDTINAPKPSSAPASSSPVSL